MKATGASLKAHYAQRVTTRARCWKLTRVDGEVFGFTEHAEALTISGVVYSSSATSFNASTVDTRAALNVDNMEVSASFDAAAFTVDDLLAGVWDFARVEFFAVNYEDTSQGIEKIRYGWLGEVRYSDNGFVAEIRGLAQRYQLRFGRAYMPACDAVVGDSRCTIDLDVFADGKVTSTVTTATSARQFTCSAITQATGWFNRGKITFTSGENAGLSNEVKTQTSAGVIVLQLPMPYTIAASDGFYVTAGCDLSLATCISKYNNAVNHRGFADIPGRDRIMSGL